MIQRLLGIPAYQIQLLSMRSTYHVFPVRKKDGTDRWVELQEFGLERIQYSVFLGNIHPRKLIVLRKKLDTINADILKSEDSIIIIELSLAKIKKMTISGELSVDMEELMGLKNTLYFQ